MAANSPLGSQTEDQKVIDYVLNGNKLEHAGSPLKSSFVLMLIDHIRSQGITTIKGVHKFLGEFVDHCDSESYIEFVESVAFSRGAIDGVLGKTPPGRFFHETMIDLMVLSDDIMKELESEPGAPVPQA